MTRYSRHRTKMAAMLVSTVSIQPCAAFKVVVLPTKKSSHARAKQKMKFNLVFVYSSIGEEYERYSFQDILQTETSADAVIQGSIESVNLRNQRVCGNEFSKELVYQRGSISKIEKERSIEDEDNLISLRDVGSTLGAAALVAGSTVGAGILALPSATVSSGFLPSTGGLVMAWIFMTMSGLLLAELTINRIEETGRHELGILDLFKAYLGKWGHYGGSAVFFVHHYLIMMAYISRGGENFSGFLNGIQAGGNFSSEAGQIMFASVAGLLLFSAKDKDIKLVNNLLVAGTCATFFGLIACGTSSMNVSELLNPIHSHPEDVIGSAPILLLSLAYQGIVPTVVKQLQGDRKKITTAIILGTLGPLIMFLLWNGIILGNVYNDISNEASLAAGAIDPVMLLQNAAHDGVSNSILPGLVSSFSQLATVTCLIGLFYGMMNAWTDTLNVSSGDKDYDTKWKPLLIGAILVPSLTVSLGNPDIFYSALEYGGAFGISILFLLLPPLMSWKNRYSDEGNPKAVTPMVPGGKLSLGTLCQVSVTIMAQQGAQKLGLFDFAGEQWEQSTLFGLHDQFAQLQESASGLLS